MRLNRIRWAASLSLCLSLLLSSLGGSVQTTVALVKANGPALLRTSTAIGGAAVATAFTALAGHAATNDPNAGPPPSSQVPPPPLVGDTAIAPSLDPLNDGQAEAFPYTATASGAATIAWLYLDASNSATSVIVGLYADAGGAPGSLLASTSMSSLVAGQWNGASLPATPIAAGSEYWLAVISPVGAGPLALRSDTSRPQAVQSNQNGQSTLPTPWVTGLAGLSGPLSAFVSMSPGASAAPEVATGAPDQTAVDVDGQTAANAGQATQLLDQSTGPAPQLIVAATTNTRTFDTGAGGCFSFFGFFFGCDPPPGAPPANWQTVNYDDTVAGWHAAVASNSGPFYTGVPFLWNEFSPAEGEGVLFRTTFALPSGAISNATLDYGVDDGMDEIFVNGNLLPGAEEGFAVNGHHDRIGLTVNPAWLNAGGKNVIAAYGYNGLNCCAGYSMQLHFTAAGGNIQLSPPTKKQSATSQATFTAMVTGADGTPRVVPVTFAVTGANSTSSVLTSTGGTATFSYTSTVVGGDSITASAVVDGQNVTSNVATMTWTPRPLVFVPGLAGSQLIATQSGTFSFVDSQGNRTSRSYNNGDTVWINVGAATADNEYFDMLRFNADGTPSNRDFFSDGNVLTVPGSYGNVIPFFTQHGYIQNTDFFVFAYDWRFSAQTNVSALDSVVQRALSTTGASTFDLVAHSMGTQVSHAYLTSGSTRNNVSHVVLLGSPSMGTPEGDYAAGHGVCLGNVPFVSDCLINQRVVQYIMRTLPGGLDQAASRAYFSIFDNSADHPAPFIDIRGTSPVIGAYDDLKNLLLSAGVTNAALTAAEGLHADDLTWFASAPGKHAVFAGTNHCTISQIYEAWVGTGSGLVTQGFDYSMGDGDGTVVRRSASFDDGGLIPGVPVHFRDAQHGDLANQSTVLTDVLSLLNDQAVAQGSVIQPSCSTISAHSPVEMVVTDAAGRRLGGPLSNPAYLEIPGARFDRFADMKVATFDVPDRYTVALTGTGTGEATIRARTISHGSLSGLTIYKYVAVTPSSRGSFSVDSIAGTASDLTVDLNGDGKTIQVYHPVSLTGAAAQDVTPPSLTVTSPSPGQTIVGAINVNWSASDAGSGLDKTTALVDSAGAAQLLTAPAVVSLAPGAHTLDFLAEDRAGRVTTQHVTFQVATPTTTATLTPTANSNGWNSTSVNVALSAAGNPDGSGVRSIAYSASGAQPIAPTTVVGNAASVPINADGRTTLAFAATDSAGNVETSESVQVQIDTRGPSCALTGVGTDAQLRKYVQVTVQDPLSGLQAIVTTTGVNATTAWPQFTPGANSPVVITATKVDQTQSAQVAFMVTDQAGNVTSCDPILTQLGDDATTGTVTRTETFHHVARGESSITVYNSTPGLKGLRIVVDGRSFEVRDLADGEKRTIDVSGAMRRGDNTITLIANGPKRGSATVLITDK